MSENVLSQDEVDSLLEGVDGGEDNAEAADPSKAQPYNLAKQERIVRGHMPTLEVINERFARLLRISLYDFFRRTVEITIDPIKVLKYNDFIQNLAVPTNLNLIQMKPLRGKGLMVIDPSLASLMVDNIFGGDGRFHTKIEGREFTQTELRILRRVLDIFFESYAKSWEPVYPVEFEYVRSETNTQFANIATPNEVVVAMTFNVELGDVSGYMHFCLPYSMLEPIKDMLTSTSQSEVLGIDQRWARLMTQQIQSAEVEIVADLAKQKLSLHEVLNLKVGDVIPMNINEEIDVVADNIPVMRCKYGLFNSQYALRVQKLLRANATEYIKGEKNGD